MPDLPRFIPLWCLIAIPVILLATILFVISLRSRRKGRAESLPPLARNALAAHLQDAVLILDHRDRLVELNPAAAQIIGKPGQMMVGRPISEVQREIAGFLDPYPGAGAIEKPQILPVNGLDLAFAVHIIPVRYGWLKRTGRMVILSSLTGREEMEKTLHEHTRELVRSNKLITTMSNVATRLGGAPSIEAGFETLGVEIRKLGLDCGIVAIDPAGETATIKYLSFQPALLRQVEKITGVSAKGHVIPKRFWPGDRILKEKQPIWYPDPHVYIRRMFPQIPDVLANQALRLLGIRPESQICILPLLVDDNLIGAMPIWGADLHPADNPVLTLFASQVAGVLQNTLIRENETMRANELARSNAMVLALSKVATLLGNSSNTEVVLDTLGSEIRGLGLDCGIVTLDQGGETATVKYLSFAPAVIQQVEKLAGVSIQDYSIPRRYWPDDRAVREKTPVWYSDPSDILLRMFPKIPEKIARRSLQLFGFSPETQLCMLPLASNEQMIGAMLIWGVDLRFSDTPVLAVFAGQVAGILQKIEAYETEVERADILTHSNSLILALSKVAAKLESSANSAEIFNTVGKELQKMGLESIIGTLDDSRQNLRIKYLSIQQDVIRWAEKMTGHSLDELSIPRRLWPTEKVVSERVPYWDPNRMRGTLNMFPILPESLHKVAMKLAGINMDDPVCYLPLANEHDVIGVLAVWGAGLKLADISALSVLASQVTTAIRNSELLESEARRTKELGILLRASETTSSASQLNDILLSLASTLLGLSGFESCYITEWNRETNTVTGLIEHSRVWWHREKRESYPLSDYPVSRQVLLTGNPVILQGEFDAGEKRWMDELGRTALVLLAMKAGRKTVGLIEIASTREKHLFEPHIMDDCQKILEETADAILEPLSENDPKVLFGLEEALLKASGGEVCSISEWDPTNNRILTLAVSADMIWAGQGAQRPEEDAAWKLALYEGKTSLWVRAEEEQSIKTGKNSSVTMDVESTIIFPLQKGNENIGLIELYDFNHKRNVTPEQLAFLRTVADKASYSIQNARLLQQAKQQLSEKTALLDEKEVLLKEVHHRVKNNLQVISSLLNLQAAKVSDPDTKDILRESQNRVRTMALIHEKLYQSSDLAQVNFRSYLQSLVTYLTQSYRERSANVTVQIEAEDVMLDIDAAIPCGLIVNELVSNSLKYAFPENQPGSIKLTCHQPQAGKYVLVVSDDGVGLPDGFDIAQAPSLGYKLVTNLTGQIEGKLELLRDRGTTCRISFERMSNAKSQNIHR